MNTSKYDKRFFYEETLVCEVDQWFHMTRVTHMLDVALAELHVLWIMAQVLWIISAHGKFQFSNIHWTRSMDHGACSMVQQNACYVQWTFKMSVKHQTTRVQICITVGSSPRRRSIIHSYHSCNNQSKYSMPDRSSRGNESTRHKSRCGQVVGLEYTRAEAIRSDIKKK